MTKGFDMNSIVFLCLAAIDPLSAFSAMASAWIYLGPILVAVLIRFLPGQPIRRAEKKVHRSFEDLGVNDKLPQNHPKVVYCLALLEQLGDMAAREAARLETAKRRIRAVAIALSIVLILFTANAGPEVLANQVFNVVERYEKLARMVGDHMKVYLLPEDFASESLVHDSAEQKDEAELEIE